MHFVAYMINNPFAHIVYQQSSVSLKPKYANLVQPMQTQFQATTPTHVVLKYKIRKHHELLISIYK